MSSEYDKVIAEYERNRKFTIDYKDLSQMEKDGLDFTKSPCNIWGFIQELITEIKDLETRIKKLEVK